MDEKKQAYQDYVEAFIAARLGEWRMRALTKSMTREDVKEAQIEALKQLVKIAADDK